MDVKISVVDDDGNIYEGVSHLLKMNKSKKSKIVISAKKTDVKKQKIKEPASIMDFLILLKDQGFFDTPRSRKDILQKLATMKKYYEPTSLDSPLNRAFNSKKLGRISKNGLYLYVNR